MGSILVWLGNWTLKESYSLSGKNILPQLLTKVKQMVNFMAALLALWGKNTKQTTGFLNFMVIKLSLEKDVTDMRKCVVKLSMVINSEVVFKLALGDSFLNLAKL